MDKALRDLKWLYETLRKGGKTAEFYEAQAPIIGEVLKHMISAQRNEILITEYLSKCHCCDECFCECWCILNNRRKGRVPHDGCKQNILDRMCEEV